MRKLGAAFLFLLAACVTTPAGRTVMVGTEDSALEQAVDDICGRDVALLGEATHGDGRTIVFKAALVRRLVTECGYNAIFFEASHYDFLDMSRRLRVGEPISEEMVASSIGRIWNQYEEMQPLIAWMSEEAAAGRLQLGGLDDQLGSAGAYYSIAAMPGDLASVLEEPRRQLCQEILRRRIYSAYASANPYNEQERTRISACLADMRIGLEARGSNPEALQMVRAFDRLLERDFADRPTMARGRDEAMFRNFEWLQSRLPRGSKIIVWTATVHAARDARASDTFPQGGSLGEHIARGNGRRAFALGFSAASGMFRFGPGTDRAIATAPPNSIEARALADPTHDVVYLDARALARMGPSISGLIRHDPLSADWSRVVDGLVVFREERPPGTRS